MAMDWLSLVGNIASIIGLGVSLWVLKQVHDVKRQYLQHARSPALLKSIVAQQTALAKLLLPSSLDTEQVSLVLASSEALLRNLQSKLTGPEAKQVKQALEKIKQARTQPINRAVAVKVQAELVAIIHATREQQNDIQWTHS